MSNVSSLVVPSLKRFPVVCGIIFFDRRKEAHLLAGETGIFYTEISLILCDGTAFNFKMLRDFKEFQVFLLWE